MPPLSVVIPSYNRPDLLHLCLTSVTRHAPAGTEILVVDDASPQGSVSAVARTFRGVPCVRLRRQRGFCTAVNAGIAAASNPIVELLNDDTEVCAGWAEAALAHFADANLVAVAPLVLCGPPHTNAPRIDSAGDCYFVGGIAAKRGHGAALTGAHLTAGPVFGASASSAFYRRDALRAVGGFPESFGAYFEDVDVSFRLNWAGHGIVFEPASRVWHRVSASYGRTQRRLLEQQARNEERVFWRNVPGALLLQALPWHAAILAAKAWRRWQEGQLLPFLFGKLRVLGDLTDLLRHRRQLRESCPAPDWKRWPIDLRYTHPSCDAERSAGQ